MGLHQKPPSARRQQLEHFAAQLTELQRRRARDEQSQRSWRDDNGMLQGGLIAFVRYFWRVLEPKTRFVDGWALEAICEHLEAVTFGEITQILINVPPGFMKSLLTDVFWPAWEWGPMGLPHLRYVAFSYNDALTKRDNGKFRDLMQSADYQAMYCQDPGLHDGSADTEEPISWFRLRKTGEKKVTNNQHGWKLATSIGGLGTGERGDRIILDDPHNIKDDSKIIREETVRWFRESMTSRLNDMETGAKVVIMQRVHEADVSGTILTHMDGYVHLAIPMEYVWDATPEGQPYANEFGWVDPRWTPDPEDCNGELAWPERFSPRVVAGIEKDLGKYAYAGQYQQTPEARGGGIIKRHYWQPWEPPDGKFPPFEYVVASLDSAYTEKESNDPSALTVWGIFREGAFSRVMLMHAWQRWLEIEGERQDDMRPGENMPAYLTRVQPNWGLIEWVNHTCTRFRADKLLIEGKATGISAAQMIRKRYRRKNWSVQLMPVKGDKVARTHAVAPSWSQGMVYVPKPLRKWGEIVIDQMAVFPKAPHDDLNDSATQAMKHLRDMNLLVSDDDFRADELDTLRSETKKSTLRAIYPV